MNTKLVISELKHILPYVVGVCALVYGYAYKDNNAMLIGLSTIGITSNIAKKIEEVLTK